MLFKTKKEMLARKERKGSSFLLLVVTFFVREAELFLSPRPEEAGWGSCEDSPAFAPSLLPEVSE